jgi:toxin ParE1/3/4
MTRLVVTADAEADTTDILDHLEREAGRRISEQYGRRFYRTIERLVDVPQSGAPRPALEPDIRIAIVSPYVLIYEYRPSDDTLTLLRILHGRRNITGGLHRRPPASLMSLQCNFRSPASAALTARRMVASENGLVITSWISASRPEARSRWSA